MLLILDKFAFKNFNYLAYDCKISGTLVACYLLVLQDYYTLSNNVKSINWGMIQRQFPDFALQMYQHTSNIDNFMRFYYKEKIISTIFEHYSVRNIQLNHFYFYIYTRIINMYFQKLAQKSDIKFNYNYRNCENQVLRHFTKPRREAKIKTLRSIM